MIPAIVFVALIVTICLTLDHWEEIKSWIPEKKAPPKKAPVPLKKAPASPKKAPVPPKVSKPPEKVVSKPPEKKVEETLGDKTENEKRWEESVGYRKGKKRVGDSEDVESLF